MLWRHAEIIVRDMYVTWPCNSFWTKSLKNNPVTGMLFFKDIKFRKNGSAVFKVFFFLFLRKIPNIYVSMEQKNGHKVTSLGELNATEIQQNIIEMFGARVYFG